MSDSYSAPSTRLVCIFSIKSNDILISEHFSPNFDFNGLLND